MPFVSAIFICLARILAQDSNPWRDPSRHTVRFLTIERGVLREVLDWGGTGPTIVLLAGLGHTAHGFDLFAPKLTDGYQVPGITRASHYLLLSNEGDVLREVRSFLIELQTR